MNREIRVSLALVMCIGIATLSTNEAMGAKDVTAQRITAVKLDLSSPRATHMNIALGDGRVLMIGGCTAGNCDAGPGSRTVDVFDPVTNRITEAGTLVQSRVAAAAAPLGNGRVLILGGYFNGAASATAEIYDSITKRSLAVGSMSSPRGDAAATALRDGRVLVVGGSGPRDGLSTSEIFDPTTGRFVKGGNLNQARSGAILTRLKDGRVLVTGGTIKGVVTASVEIFDPVTNAFSPTGQMLEARYKHAAQLLSDGRVLIVGGADETDYRGKKRSLEIYDPAKSRFVSAGMLKTARFKIRDSVVLLENGNVLIAGGARFPEIVNPATGTVATCDLDLGEAWSYMTANGVTKNRVLVAGGYAEGNIRITATAWLIQN